MIVILILINFFNFLTFGATSADHSTFDYEYIRENVSEEGWNASFNLDKVNELISSIENGANPEIFKEYCIDIASLDRRVENIVESIKKMICDQCVDSAYRQEFPCTSSWLCENNDNGCPFLESR